MLSYYVNDINNESKMNQEINNQKEASVDEIDDMSDDELLSLLNNIDYEEEIKTINKLEASTQKQIICEKCNSENSIAQDTSEGIIVCMNCGTVQSEIFDNSPEWKQYNDSGKDLSRCNNATNIFLPQSSLGSTIACSSRCKIKILEGWSAMPYKERSLNIVLKDIQAKCRSVGILKCIEDDAKILYKNISESKHLDGKNKGKHMIVRGSNRKSLIAACVFYACKRKEKTRSPKEIAKLFGLKYKDMTKGCKIFLRLIKLKNLNYEINVSNAQDFITRYCRDLHINNELIAETIKIAKNIQKLNIASMHAPYSIAAGSILLTIQLNNLNIDRKSIAKKFGVSDVTIIKAYKQIETYKDIILNDELTEQIAILLEQDRQKIKIPSSLENIYKKMDCDSVVKTVIGSSYNNNDENMDNNIFKLTTINNNNLQEYFDDIDLEIYDILKETEYKYNELMENYNHPKSTSLGS